MNRPWFKSRTLRFECTGCSDCCRKPGQVYLYRKEADRIAAYWTGDKRATAEALLGDIWLECEDGRFVIEVPAVKGCPFLDGNDCSIHPVKPWQCKTYPFWPEILIDEFSWEQERAFCEGIRPDGKEYEMNDIVALLRERGATRESG